jgi:hypothetical protein
VQEIPCCTGAEALNQHTADPHVLLVDSPDAVRRQAAPLGK